MHIRELFEVSETSLLLIIVALVVVVMSTTYVAAYPESAPSTGLANGVANNAIVNGDIGIANDIYDGQNGIYIDFAGNLRLGNDKNLVLGEGGKILNNSSSGQILIQDTDGIILDGNVEIDRSHTLDTAGASEIFNSTWTRVRVAGNIEVEGDIKGSSTSKIGSYFMINDQVSANSVPRALTGIKYEDTIDCPANTRIVSCNGWIEEGYGCPPGEQRGLGCNVSLRELGPTKYHGSSVDISSNSCTSYYGNTYLGVVGESEAFHHIEAVCFDPTVTNTGIVSVDAY